MLTKLIKHVIKFSATRLELLHQLITRNLEMIMDDGEDGASGEHGMIIS